MASTCVTKDSTPHKAIRLFFILLYGEHRYPWIRRHGYRFAIDRTPVRELLGVRTRSDVDKLFVFLRNMGWIYSYRQDVTAFRFTVRPPHWLALSGTAPLTERYVQWDRQYDGDNKHIDSKYINALSSSYPERRASFDNLVEAVVESDIDSPRTVEDILCEET